MTELETKIWNTVHNWCDAQSNKIPDQNRRYLMDEIKALVSSNVVGQREKLVCVVPDCKNEPIKDAKHGLCGKHIWPNAK